jgi:epoxyqueuosine reductase
VTPAPSSPPIPNLLRYDGRGMPLNLLLKRKAVEIGFDIVGIAPATAWKELNFARKWVEQGYGGEMRYLENAKRYDPRLVLPSAQSVICVGLIYNTAFPYSTEVGKADRTKKVHPRQESPHMDDTPHAWISRYAWGRDYHEIVRKRLEVLRKAVESLAPGAETRVYADTGPVIERAFARHSGIGWIGKNTCLINPSKGSWFFLGVILTSLPLEPDLPAPDRCGSCRRCLEACPTGALTEPYFMDASRCIAYFNIELKGPIPEQYRPQIGSNIFGCDICQDVCPWNRSQKPQPRTHNTSVSHQLTASGPPPVEKGLGRRGASTTALPEFQPIEINLPVSSAKTASSINFHEVAVSGTMRTQSSGLSFSLFNPPIQALSQLTEEDFRRVFAHSPIKRTKYRGWLRNLCVAMGNSGDRRFIPRLEELSCHQDHVIRQHASWALQCLSEVPKQHPGALPPRAK